jgi:hypothetical protein
MTAANDEQTSPISIRRKSSIELNQVPVMKASTAIIHPSATYA